MQAFARQHPGLLLTGLLLLYSGLKLSALAQGNLPAALALVQTVGTGEILLAAVTQMAAQTAWPALLSTSIFAAFAGVARWVAIPVAALALRFGLLLAPWFLLLLGGVAGLILGWAELRPGGHAERASAWFDREPARPTVIAVGVAMFAFMAAALPIKAGEHVTLKDGSLLAGEVYGADEGFVVILTTEGDLHFVPQSAVLRRELCRRPVDVTWQSARARFRPQLPSCGRSRVADAEANRDAASSDDDVLDDSPRG